MFWTRSFLELRCVCVCVCVYACSVPSFVSNSLRPCGLKPARLLCPRDSPGKNTGVGCRAFLQGIFPTQGSNPHLLCLLHCRWVLYCRVTGEAQKYVSPWDSWDRKHCPKKLRRRSGSFGALIWVLIVMGWRWGHAETLSQAPSPTNCDSVTFSSFKAFCRLESAKHAI